jgi:hypothetical protein
MNRFSKELGESLTEACEHAERKPRRTRRDPSMTVIA